MSSNQIIHRKSFRLVIATLLFTLFSEILPAQKTYCNPMNLDYGYCPIPDFTESGKHRATADPVIVLYKGDYYLFSSNQWGYWWSNDLNNWNFISRSFLKPYHKVYDD
jgi:xylan 1,4-beta-xylosidase